MRRSHYALLGIAVALGLVTLAAPLVGSTPISAVPQMQSSPQPSSDQAEPEPSPSVTTPTPAPKPFRKKMPKKSTRGFEHLAAQGFDQDAAAGNVASRDGTARPYNDWILPYANWSGNHGGQYRFQENVSVHDGVLDVRVRSFDGMNTGAAWIWLHPDPSFRNYGFTYGAVEQRIKVVGHLPGYGAANLLWPDSEDRADGEMDFPEGGFVNDPKAYHHCLGKHSKKNCLVLKTGVSWSDWHVYRIEWRPSGTSYYLDGKLIGTNTDSTPSTSHHWVTQMAPNSDGYKDPDIQGHYLVDWVRFESMSSD